MPVTLAPRRASGSETSPPPHPTSRIESPRSGFSSFAGRPKWRDQRVADETEPGGALLVQRAQLAVGVPPLAGQLLEALDLGRVEVGRALRPGWGRCVDVLAMPADTGGRKQNVKARDIAGWVGCR